MHAMHKSQTAWPGGTANMQKSKNLAMHIDTSNQNWRPALVESVYGLILSQRHPGTGVKLKKATLNDEYYLPTNRIDGALILCVADSSWQHRQHPSSNDLA